MELESVIAYGLLLLGALLFTATNLFFNIKLNVASDGKTITLILTWGGVLLALVTLAKMAVEVLA